MLQNRLLANFKPNGEKSKITMRLFISEQDAMVNEIRKTADEQGSNLLLIGLDHDEIDLNEAEKYVRLKNDPTNSEAVILDQMGEKESETLKQVSSLLERNRIPTGIFLDNGLAEINQIFIPVLCKADMHIFTFIYQTALKENVQIMVWDAVGIIQSGPKMQNCISSSSKRATDGYTSVTITKRLKRSLYGLRIFSSPVSTDGAGLSTLPLPGKIHFLPH